MKIAYFDCQFGAAGDMLVASLFSAGLDEKTWLTEVGKIALPENSFTVKVSDVMRCSIACKKVDVLDSLGEQLDPYYDKGFAYTNSSTAAKHEHEHQHAHSHSHGSGHAHEHGAGSHEQTEHEQGNVHSHTHSHEHDHKHDHGEHTHSHAGGERHLGDVLKVIADSSISSKAKDLAARIFKRLARAEGKVHGVAPEDVHFHEVGAVDAIVDILGFAIAYDLLGIERAYVSAVPLGQGRVKTEHGLFPAPGPATVFILTEAEAPTRSSELNFECLTPTGAAILAEVSHRWGSQPSFSRLLTAGYGAGTKNPADFPNATRVLIGELASAGDSGLESETIAVIEANIDDFTPQALAFAAELLHQNGALDVIVVPAVMKKGRSGHLLTVLSKPGDRLRLQELVMRETSSIGTRFYECQRLVALREWQSVQLNNEGSVRVKIAKDSGGKVLNAQPEYDDCVAYATANGIPLKQVMAQVMAKFWHDNS